MDTVHSELSMPQVFGRMKPDEARPKWVDSPSDFVNLEETHPKSHEVRTFRGNPAKSHEAYEMNPQFLHDS